MRFWLMMLLMKLVCGRRNWRLNLKSYLNFYPKRFRSNWCLREIHMEMFRWVHYILICIVFADQCAGMLNALAVFWSLGCQDWDRKDAYPDGRNWAGEEKGRRHIQGRVQRAISLFWVKYRQACLEVVISVLSFLSLIISKVQWSIDVTFFPPDKAKNPMVQVHGSIVLSVSWSEKIATRISIVIIWHCWLLFLIYHIYGNSPRPPFLKGAMYLCTSWHQEKQFWNCF